MSHLASLLTIREMADKLRVPTSWIYARTRIKNRDTIPHTRVGKYLRFEEAKVMQWLQKQQEGQKA